MIGKIFVTALSVALAGGIITLYIEVRKAKNFDYREDDDI